MTEDITKPLQGMGTKTQEIIPYAMTGKDVTRVGMRKANALRELAAGQEAMGQGIASALKSIGGAVERMGGGDAQDMARQGDIEGRKSVARDEQGDIIVQPTTSSLFGKSGEHYANAAYSGAVDAGRNQLRSDLTRIAAENAGNPEGLKSGINGYLQGHLGGLGSGQVGQTLMLDAKDYGQQLVDGAITKKAASDIGAAEKGILASTKSQQTDLEALAFGGATDSDAYKTTLAAQQTKLDDLASNPAFGVSPDEVAATKKDNAFRIQDATIQGAMGSAFHNGGLNASAAVVDSISTRTDLSDADKARLKFSADAVLERQKSSNSSDISTNQTAFKELMQLQSKGTLPPLQAWQDIQKRAVFLGDNDTSRAAGQEITNHHWVEKAVTLSPSQQDRANGVGLPPRDDNNFQDANIAMNLTPQEKALYQRHLANLTGPGGVDNPNGSRSTLFKTTVEVDGKTYVIPTVWDGKKVSVSEAFDRAKKEGLQTFPSYKTRVEAEERYNKMHSYMEKDTAAVQQGKAAAARPPGVAVLVNQSGGDVNRAVDDAFTQLGKNENVNRAELKEYLRTGGHNLDPKTQAYCAAFVGAALQHAGIQGAASNLASDYLNWGKPVIGSVLKGDVLVIDRGVLPGQRGDHVGFATGKTDASGRVEMISGNTQNGQVATEFIDRTAVIARRYDPSGSRVPSARDLTDAFIQQESSGGPGAPGNIGQIQFGTWNQYARPGEQIGNQADNRAVVGRILADYSKRYNGDVERIAVAYFSGPGNVSPPGSPTPWIVDKSDGRKQVSSYVQDIAGRRAGSVGNARAAPGVTWDDLHNNPGMAPTYIKSLAAETDTRSRFAETLIDSSTKSMKNNTPVSQESMVQIEQLATPEARASNPQLDAKYKEYEKTLVASNIASGGGSIIDQARAEALAQPDILPRQMVDLAQEIRKSTETQLKENPVAAALNGKMIGRPPAPLNPGDPQSIPLHFAGNAAVVDAISAREPGFSKSVVFKNEVGAFGATMAGPAQAGLAVLSSIQALPRDKQDATLEMPEVRAAILGMANSTDPDKKRAAFAFMDHIYRQEPQTFEGKFEHKGLLLLRDWQDTQQFHTDEEIAKAAATAYDPSTIRAQEALAKTADKILERFTPAAVANKLAPYWFAANTPISDNTAQANAILLEDHNRAFKEMYERHGNETSAYNYAAEAIKIKWGPSVANGGRVMAYPPEKSPAYPEINGSKDYIGKQLEAFVAAAGHAGAEAHLVPSKDTRTEMITGKPTGYGVVVQGNDKQYVLIPGRFYADPAPFKQESDARLGEGQLSGRRTAREFFRR